MVGRKKEMLQFIVYWFFLAKFFASPKRTSEKYTKKPSAKPGTIGRWPKGKANRVPKVKVLNYLKKVALFSSSASFIFANSSSRFVSLVPWTAWRTMPFLSTTMVRGKPS